MCLGCVEFSTILANVGDQFDRAKGSGVGEVLRATSTSPASPGTAWKCWLALNSAYRVNMTCRDCTVDSWLCVCVRAGRHELINAGGLLGEGGGNPAIPGRRLHKAKAQSRTLGRQAARTAPMRTPLWSNRYCHPAMLPSGAKESGVRLRPAFE